MPPLPRTLPRTLAVVLTSLATAIALGAAPASAHGTGPTGPASSARAHAESVLAWVRQLLVPDGRPGPAGRSARAAAPSQTAGDLTLALRDLALARPSLSGSKRALADRILARPTDHALLNDTDLIDYSADELRHLHSRCSRHFCVHWTSSDRARSFDLDNSATRATATRDLTVLEHVYGQEITRRGFRQPLSDQAESSPDDVGNPDGRFDVFLVDLGAYGYYGYTAVSQQSAQQPQRASAFLVLDNNFARYKFCPPDVARKRCTSPIDNLRVTVAHEFFHAIQYGYDDTEASWLLEGSAVWMEDQVYDGINDYRQYVPVSPIRHPRRPVDDNGRLEPLDIYGAFTLCKFLTGWLHDPDAVRQIWEYAASPQVYSLQAVDRVIRDHGFHTPTAYAHFGVWNTLPPGAYRGERRFYGRPHYAHRRTLRPGHRSTGWQSAPLWHLANTATRLTPGRGLGRHARLRVTVNLPRHSHHPAATVQVRWRSGKVSVHRIRLNRWGNGHRTVRFSHRAVRSVVVVLTNGSTALVGCRDNADPYSCGGHGEHDLERYRVRARAIGG